jgi:hypothetical protein
MRGQETNRATITWIHTRGQGRAQISLVDFAVRRAVWWVLKHLRVLQCDVAASGASDFDACPPTQVVAEIHNLRRV